MRKVVLAAAIAASQRQPRTAQEGTRMTDTLPRQIPTDPAEQGRLMPEWVFRAAWERTLSSASLPPRTKWREYIVTFSRALGLWEWMPEPVDPDLLMAREVCAVACVGPNSANAYREGLHDNSHAMKACLAMAKRVREAKQ